MNTAKNILTKCSPPEIKIRHGLIFRENLATQFYVKYHSNDLEIYK